ncbi:MAG TPA: hypothetical protein VFI02_00455 [Armatimonadota bacterium]|nr:hypothetical protein [Armatimonadota bacterium]
MSGRIAGQVFGICAVLALVSLLAGCGGGGGGERSDIIAFHLRDGGGATQIWVTDADGSPPIQLTTLGTNIRPSISGNGRIVFHSYRDGNPEIYIMNADGTGQQRLTDDPANDWLPAISWDGTKVAFASDRGGTENIYVMNANGTGLTQLASGTDLRGCAFSKDGSTLAFVSDLDIYTVPSVGGTAVRILSNPGIDESPCYNPDGQKIAFARNTDGRLQVWVANADGSDMDQLTDEPEGCGWPSWSPDGSKIVFIPQRGGEYRLYTMNPDGTNVVPLLPDTEIDEENAWTSWGQQ